MTTPETKLEVPKKDNSDDSSKINRIDNLTREMKLLIKQLKAVMESNQNIRFNKGPNPIEVCLNKYSKEFGGTIEGIEDHVKPFAQFYLNNRSSILANLGDEWLESGKFTVKFGEGIPDMPSTTRDIKMMISSIYTTSKNVKKVTEEKLKGMSDEARESAVELIYPDTILLHLYRIFLNLQPVGKFDDTKSLTEIVNNIEEELGVRPNQSNKSNDPINSLSSLAISMAKNMGIDVPEGSIPQGDALSNVLNKVVNNKGTKDVMGKIM